MAVNMEGARYHERFILSTRSVLTSFGIVSFFTFVSRIFGLIRDIASASLFGTTLVWDAFLVSFTVPNLFRRLLGEGALSSSFIPVFADSLKKDGKKGAWQLVNLVFSLLLVTTTCLVLAGIVFLFISEGVLDVSEKGTLVFSLMRILLPYLILINLTALLIAALHSLGVFAVPASSPVILNLVWIASLFFICPYMGKSLGSQAHGLAFGLVGAGLLQVGFQCWALMRQGWRFHFCLGLDHPGVRRMLSLMGPAAAGLMLHQLNMTIDLVLGYSLGDGAVSSLWYGSRLMQFPLAIFAIALGTVVFPKFSGQTAARQLGRLKETLSFSLRALLVIIIPASVGLIVLREPIIFLLFERNQFDAVSTHRAATTLAFYCLGLFAYAGAKVFVPCFYALKDTRTPVRIVAWAVGINLILNLILMQFLKEGGLALATSLSGILELGLLYFYLRKKVGPWDGRGILSTMTKVMIASLGMGIVTLLGLWWVQEGWSVTGLAKELASVAFPIGVGALSYFLFCWFLHVHELRSLVMKLRGLI